MENLIETFNTNFGFLKSKEIVGRTQWRTLNKMLNDNSVSKVKRGLYRLNEDIKYDQHVEVAKMIPNGVFCMFTAWRHYNLSVYNPYEFYVAIRKKQKIVLPTYPPIKLFYWIDKFYLLGITEIIIENQIVNIYNLEKSVCDAVRFRNKIGADMMSEILKNYLKRQDKDLNKLAQYANQLRIEKVMREIVTVML